MCDINMSLFDVLVEGDEFPYEIIQIMGMSEADVRHICEIKGYYVIDIVKNTK